MALGSQASSHARHEMPCRDRQALVIAAFQDHWGTMSLENAPDGQASAHAPQKVQAPREKSRTGKFPAPATMICSGQASTQALQPLQCSVSSAAFVPGGRRTSGAARPPSFKKARRLTEMSVPSVMPSVRRWARPERAAPIRHSARARQSHQSCEYYDGDTASSRNGDVQPQLFTLFCHSLSLSMDRNKVFFVLLVVQESLGRRTSARV